MNFDFNTTIVAGNELWRLVTLFGVVTVALIIGKLGRIALSRSSVLLESRGQVIAAATLQALAVSSSIIAIAVAFPIGAAFLVMGENILWIVRAIHGVLLSVAIGFTFYQLIDVVFAWMNVHASKSDNSMNDMLLPIVRTSLRVTVVVLTLLQIAQSLTDKPLTSIIAGLGVGGLAVALAAQDTLKHFFGSIVLFSDKPFKVGERITVDATDGVVEEVGFRSTRIRTLEGHLVTIPNGDLANKTINNIGRRPHIRQRMVLNLTYDTPPEKIRRAIDLILSMLENHEGMLPEFPPRVVFDEFASASLNILVMYWYHPADYWKFKDFSEKLNLNILEKFNAEGIDFAFPTQTLIVTGDQKHPLTVNLPEIGAKTGQADR